MKPILATTIVLVVVIPALAQDDTATAKQKSATMANLAKAGLKTIASAEAKDVQVLTSLSESRAKAFADAGQKTYLFAQKALKLDDKLWPGKLTLIVLGDPREYSSYVRVVTQSRPDPNSWFTINIRGDVPTAVVVLNMDSKPKDAELNATVSTIIAAALLNKKAGTGPTTGTLPEWLQIGFGKLMVLKNTGGTTWSDYRTKSKAVVVGTKSKPSPVRLTEFLNGVKFKDSDIVATSLVEYMMYGIEGDKFFAFASGFKPSENAEMPTIASVFEAVEWKMDAFEISWKIWLSKQK